MRTLLALLLLSLPTAVADGTDPMPILPPPPVCMEDCDTSGAIPLPNGCTVQPAWNGGVWCDDPGICAVLDDPVCWTFRFSCYYLEQPMQGVLGWRCETQPENGTTEPGGEPPNCDNYGVLVVISVGSRGCEGESCQNYGVLVVVGDYCGHSGIDACAGSYCLDDICVKDLVSLDSGQAPAFLATALAPLTVATPTTGPIVSSDREACGN